MRLLALVLALAAQAAPRSFEVASIKPHEPGNPRAMMVADASGLHRRPDILAVMLIRTTYGPRDDQVVGGPVWLRSARFDITAKTEDAAANLHGPCLQSLLADRGFRMTSHRRALLPSCQSYALVKARSDNECSSGLASFPTPACGTSPSRRRRRNRASLRCGGISEGFGRMTLERDADSNSLLRLQYLAPVNRVHRRS
jgi:uncharacterized protein (TIGR03435 family)